jgi:nitrogen fixation protein FixH
MTTALQRRNPWPIAITAWFLVFGGLVFSFTLFALRQKTDLVTSDYYEQEMQYQQQIERLGRTQGVKQQVTVEYVAAARQITVRLPKEHQSAQGTIRLYRPSDATADLRLRLTLDASATQTFDAARLQPGLWKVRVQWSVGGEEYYVDETVVIESGGKS